MSIPVGVPAPPSSTPPPSSAPAGAPLTPQILWPSLARAGHRAATWLPIDLNAFPDAMVIRERRDRGEASTWLPMFKKHVSSATERVLIVDTYLLCGGERAEDEVLSWFPDSLVAHDVRIACGGVRAGRSGSRFEAVLADRTAAINQYKGASGTRATKIKLRLNHDPGVFPYVHDRFAVVDDELWHFGSTVGGLHHGVTAASRGWSATAVKAEQFFKEVWAQRVQRDGNRTACNAGNR